MVPGWVSSIIMLNISWEESGYCGTGVYYATDQDFRPGRSFYL